MDEVVDLRLAKAESLHAAVEVRIRHARLVVVIDHVPERRERAVVHVRRGDGDVAEGHRLERADVVHLLGHEEATELGELALQSELVDLLLVAGVDERDRLARELREVLLVRGNADVVELLVAEERRHRVAGMTRVATPASVEDRPPASRRSVDRVLVAVDVAVEGRVARELRALEGGDGGREVVVVDLAAEDLLEGVDVLGELLELGDDVLGRLLTHLDRVQDRELGLGLERGGATVPELRRVEHRVQDRGRVPLPLLLPDALRRRLVIDEAGLRIVARLARRAVVGAQALVVEELVAERDQLRRRHAVRGDRERVQHRRHAERQVLRHVRRRRHLRRAVDVAGAVWRGYRGRRHRRRGREAAACEGARAFGRDRFLSSTRNGQEERECNSEPCMLRERRRAHTRTIRLRTRWRQ